MSVLRAIACAFALYAGVFGCASALTSADRVDLGEYTGEKTACIAAHPGPANQAAHDACVQEVKKRWCAKWQAEFDAGMCP